MGQAIYRVLAAGDGYCIEHDGDKTAPYATREAALEAAIGPASNAIKEGHDVVIEVRRDDDDKMSRS